ncbi:MAG: carboxypeptidase regulatory-like domain-containing protein [Acidobacteria bacterium]|nr:carboxypeptidase regulatory-like domain-containing protein [Acidobacteriota bacterium]
MKFVFGLILTLTFSAAAARCPEPNPSWVVDDDRIDGIVSIEGRPLKRANIQLSSAARTYRAVTDAKGAFLIPSVAVGSYTFVAHGWGKAHLEIKGWHRGAINRPVLSFNSVNGCRFLMEISN